MEAGFDIVVMERMEIRAGIGTLLGSPYVRTESAVLHCAKAGGSRNGQ